MSQIKRNERDWAGQLISWIKDAINKGLHHLNTQQMTPA